MSDIPSRLSTWEPPRWLKVAFLAFATTAVIALFAARVFDHTVGVRLKLESALQVQRLDAALPELPLVDREGKPVRLSDLRGKVVFVNLWATWCEPCRQEMPSLAELAKSLDPNDVAFVAVSVDDAWAPVDRFFAGGPVPFTLLRDEGKKASAMLGTDKFPESFVVDRDGRLRYRIVGARDWSVTAARKLIQTLDVKGVAAAPRG